MPRSVVIVHPGALGDVLLALPALRALRSSFPCHEHVVIADSEVGKLLRSCAEITELIPIEQGALAALLAGETTVPTWLRECLGHCDLMVGWMGDTDGRLAATLEGLGVHRTVVRSPSALEFEGLHQSDRFLQTVREVVWPGDYRHALSLAERDLTRAGELLVRAGVARRGVIALHPGSGSRHKCCAFPLFSAACGALSSRGYQPILLGGPADESLVADVVAHCAVRPPVFTGLDIVSMAALLTHVVVYIGHDSGLTHLASALHRPTIALFGPTQVQRWAPQGSHVRVLTGTPCRCSTWAEVQACPAKPCLDISTWRLVRMCEKMIRQQRRLDADLVRSGEAPCSDR